MTQERGNRPALSWLGSAGPARRLTAVAVLAIASAIASCRSGPPLPVALDPGHDQCAYCRMIVSDARFASEIVAPDEEPRFVDDLGCLANYLSEHPLAADAIVYVADHRTKAWVRASEATYTRAATVTAPMGSHIVAHVSAASRDADTEVRKGDPVDPANALTRPGGSR